MRGQTPERQIAAELVETVGARPGLIPALEELLPDMPRPGQDIDSLAGGYPDFMQYKTVLDIKDQTERSAALASAFRDQVTIAHETLREDVADAMDSIAVVERFAVDQFHRDQGQRQRQIRQVKAQGIRSGIHLASSLIALENPEAAKKTEAVANFVFEVDDAVSAFKAANNLVEGLTGFAVATMTLDIISAGSMLISAFIDTGPTLDEMLVDQMHAMKRQIDDLGQQMSERFNIVDERLLAIHQDLRQGFAEVIRGEQNSLRVLLARLENLDEDLRELKGEIERNRFIMLALNLRPCTEWQEVSDVELTRFWYVKCVATIQSLIVDLEHEATPTQQAFLEYRARRGPEGRDRLPTTIVSSDSWRSLAETHDQFFADWTRFERHYKGEKFGREMAAYREDLIAFIDDLRDDYLRWRTKQPSALRSIESELDALAHEMGGIARRIVKDLESTTSSAEHAWRATPSSILYDRIEAGVDVKMPWESPRNPFVFAYGRSCRDGKVSGPGSYGRRYITNGHETFDVRVPKDDKPRIELGVWAKVQDLLQEDRALLALLGQGLLSIRVCFSGQATSHNREGRWRTRVNAAMVASCQADDKILERAEGWDNVSMIWPDGDRMGTTPLEWNPTRRRQAPFLRYAHPFPRLNAKMDDLDNDRLTLQQLWAVMPVGPHWWIDSYNRAAARLALSLYEKRYNVLNDHRREPIRGLPRPCRKEIRERYKRDRQSLSNRVRASLLADANFLDAEKRYLELKMLFETLIDVLMGDYRNTLMSMYSAHIGRLPLPSEVLEAMDGDAHIGTFADDLVSRIRDATDLARSDRSAAVLGSGSDNYTGLARTSYIGIPLRIDQARHQ